MSDITIKGVDLQSQDFGTSKMTNVVFDTCELGNTDLAAVATADYMKGFKIKNCNIRNVVTVPTAANNTYWGVDNANKCPSISSNNMNFYGKDQWDSFVTLTTGLSAARSFGGSLEDHSSLNFNGVRLDTLAPFNTADLSGVSFAGARYEAVPTTDPFANATMPTGFKALGLLQMGPGVKYIGTNALPLNVTAQGTALSNQDLTGATFKFCTLTSMVLRGATLTNVDFEGSSLAGSQLRGANLSGAKLGAIAEQTVAITGINISGTPLSLPTAVAATKNNYTLIGGALIATVAV